MLTRHSERGDTLIEVIFAFTIFALVIVGAISLMNQGLATSQRSLELTQVRQYIDSQAETLRFMHDSYVAVYQNGVTSADLTGPAQQWALMSEQGTTTTRASQFGADANGACPAIPGNAFVVDPRTATFISRTARSNVFQSAMTTARLEFDTAGTLTTTRGLWVEAVKSGNSTDPAQQNIGFIDFHIRACWDTIGMRTAMTTGTIVRLYEPRNS